jgi:hypothetical protein
MVDEIAQVEFGLLDLHPPAFDPGQVQDAVDQFKQGIPVGHHDVEVMALLRRDVGFREQLRHAEDRVHRGADSCDMLDRNSDLAFEADSAAMRLFSSFKSVQC